MAPLAVELVRRVARRHGYTEICHNEPSCLLSLRKSSTRINVYYTTGTVGTCLNHPKRGKTQLFRRNVDPAALESIFANPRVHTGTGYYRRNNVAQKWMLEGTREFVGDSARRWQYVGETTGLLLKHKQDKQTVMEICTEWDGLYWDEGDLPDIRMEHTNYSCGSHGGLMKMVYDVMRDTCGDFQCYSHIDDECYQGFDIPYNHACDNLRRFMDIHRRDVKRIKRKFMTLNRDVRIELMQWLLGREVCGLHFADLDGDVIMTKWSVVVHFANIEYGELMYPQKAGLCSCCGVVTHSGSS